VRFLSHAEEVTVSHLGPQAAASIGRSIGVSPALSPAVSRAQKYIWCHIGEPLTLAKIARIARCSRRYLCARFPFETGETVGAHIRRVRLHLAADEIRSGVKIAAVARRVGYRSYGNFVRRFREAFGAAPGAFRCAVMALELDRDEQTEPNSR
jgi:AraC family transcriptional regulator